MTSALQWATVTGDVWADHWPAIDLALSDLAIALNAAIAAAAPPRPFRALDIGCGTGSTSITLADARPDASIIACDLSPPLVRIAGERFAGRQVRAVLGDAEAVASREAPFDLIFSRHGVMFFADPVKAFATLRAAANPGAELVFSCFQDWAENSWADELTSAAAGRTVPPPGREPSGFAFAETDYVQEILSSAGWTDVRWRPVPFRYVAARGSDAVDDALAFLGAIGPASRVIGELPEWERGDALQRMRSVIERHFNGEVVEFSAAAWIYSARSDETPETWSENRSGHSGVR